MPQALQLHDFGVGIDWTKYVLFYLGDWGDKGTISENDEALSSHMGDAT